MIIPARILREHLDDLPQCRARRPASTRELAELDMLLTAGQHLIARFGRPGLTLAFFTRSLRIPVALFHRHFCDLDDLLAEILRRHLRHLSAVIGAVPREHPDRRRAQRAAYIAATRCGIGGHTALHRMLLRDRHALPADLAEQIDKLHYGIGEALAGNHADIALGLLDMPYHSAAVIEPALASMIAAIAAEDEALRTAPRPTPDPEPELEPEPEFEAAAEAQTGTELPASAWPPRPRPANGTAEGMPDWLLAYAKFEKARAGP